MKNTNNKLDALFGALDKAVSADIRTVTFKALVIEVTPLTMKMFTDFAAETADAVKDDDEDTKSAKTSGSLIQMLSRRITKITVGDTVVDISSEKEAEEALSGIVMNMPGDDAGELLDLITETVGLGKMLGKADSKT